MSNSKKILSVILALILALSSITIMPLSAAAAQVEAPTNAPTDAPTEAPTEAVDSESFNYIVENGEATITGYYGRSKNIIIPTELGGCPVTAIGVEALLLSEIISVKIPGCVTKIGDSAFQQCESLKSVELCEGIQTIGESAFYSCVSLEEITLPDSVTEIDYEVFGECSKLKSVTLSSKISAIPDNAFYGCTSLEEITLPENVRTLDSYAFSDCTALKKVALNDKITTLSYSAFMNCSALEEIEVPASVEFIENTAFIGCSSLRKITLLNPYVKIGGIGDFGDSSPELTIYGYTNSFVHSLANAKNIKFVAIGEIDDTVNYVYTTADGEATITGYKGYATTLAIPSELGGYPVTAIYYAAFRGKAKIKEVEIPDSVTEIMSNAFGNCSALNKLTLPDYIDVMESSFNGCSPELTVYGKTNSDAEYIANREGLPFVSTGDAGTIDDLLCYEYTLDNGEATITKYNGHKKNLTLPTEIEGCPVTAIGQAAFKNNERLERVTLPMSITAIGAYAFSGCAGLTEFDLPDSLTSIEDGTFSKCTGLTEIEIPASVTTVESGAFSDCTGLTEFVFPDSVTHIGSGTLYSCTNLRKVTVSAYAFFYKFLDNCSPELTVYGYSGSYAEYYFAGDTEYPFVVIGKADDLPDNYIYSIADGEATITGYRGYAHTLEIPSELGGCPVTSIGDSAFNDKKTVTEVTFPDSVNSIGSKAFMFCKNLVKITIPKTVVSIGAIAFWTNNSATTMYGFSNTCAERYAEKNNIPFVTLGEVDNTSYFDYTVEDGKATITRYRGYQRDLTIPDTLDGYPVVAIGTDAFIAKTDTERYDEDMLTRVVIPESVKSIAAYAFNYQRKLTDVTILSKDAEIDEACCIGRTYEWHDDIFEYQYTVRTIEGFTLRGYTGSTADAYSTQFQLNFVALDHEPIDDSDKLFAYSVYGGKAHIKGYTGNADEVVIPDTLGGYPVVSIESRAFAGENIKRVTLPDSVTRIEASAFENCSALNKVTLPDNAVSIGDNAFRNCKALDNITIPAGAAVGQSAFDECSSLETITFEEKPEYIGRQAFHNTPWYDNQPDGHVYIYDIAYAYKGQCPALLEYRPGTRQISNLDPETKPTAVIIPDGITELPFMFWHRTLKSIVIPASVTEFNYLGYDSIGSTEGFVHDDLVIIGKRGSAAEEYANTKGCTFAVYAPSEDDEVAVSAPEGCAYSFVDKHGAATADEATADEAVPYEEEPLPEGAVILDSYDITLYDPYGNPVQPESPVTIRIRCDDPTAHVYRRETDGSLTDMRAVYEDGWLVFDADHFSLYIVATGAEVDLAICGDADGDGQITTIDATMIQRHIAHLATGVPEEILMRGDVNGDGEVNVLDATLLLRYLAQLNVPYPIGEKI